MVARHISLVPEYPLFTATDILLKYYSNRAPPQLFHETTLNAIISILATFAMMLIMVPVGTCLGKLKWIRAKQAGFLYDFEVMDEASKSIWESIKL